MIIIIRSRPFLRVWRRVWPFLLTLVWWIGARILAEALQADRAESMLVGALVAFVVMATFVLGYNIGGKP